MRNKFSRHARTIRGLFESAKTLRETNIPKSDWQTLKEAVVLDDGLFDVVIITEGKGNPKDRHFYTKEFIETAAPIFNGKPCFADHPSLSEETDRPERSVRDIIGYFENVRPEGGALRATLRILPGASYEWARTLCKEAIAFAQKFPGQNLCGISINAKGETEEGEIDGEVWNIVTRATDAVSADLVTLPARGGRILGQKEALREALNRVKLLDVLSAVRKKIEELNAEEKPGSKDLIRMLDTAIALANIDEEKGEDMVNPEDAHPELVDYPEEELAAEAYKHMAEKYKKMAEDEDEDEAKRERYRKMAEKYHKMAEEARRKASEDEARRKASEDEDEDESEARRKASEEETGVPPEILQKKVESMRKKLENLTIEKKIRESGLPQRTHKFLAIALRGKSEKEMDEIIEAKREEYEAILQESLRGDHFLPKFSKGSDYSAKAKALLVESGLISEEEE